MKLRALIVGAVIAASAVLILKGNPLQAPVEQSGAEASAPDPTPLAGEVSGSEHAAGTGEPGSLRAAATKPEPAPTPSSAPSSGSSAPPAGGKSNAPVAPATGSAAPAAAKGAPVAPPPSAPASGALAAPLPKPLIKTHFNSGSGKYLFKDRAWDLSQVVKAFNGVIVAYGDPRLIDDVRAAGLAAMVEFDEKDNYVKGKPVGPTVQEIIRQVKAHPGTIAGIRVADRVNQRLSPELAIAYLEATGGVFHREIPGVPIVVDVEDWELTCGLAGQSSCTAHIDDDYRYCTNEVLVKIYKSGYVDGFELAVNLKKDDPEAMVKAITKARSLFPKPFLIYARTASLSFDGDHYPDDAAAAKGEVEAYINAPLRAGVDGIDLWAWHRPWKAELRTFLDKSGNGNPLWDEMTRAYAAAVPAAKK